MRRSPMPPRKRRLSPGTSGLTRGRFTHKVTNERPERGNYRLRAVGNNSHSKDWRREWPGLKRELERAGITRCERCGSDYFLTPAHSLKRRHITNRTQMREVAILCAPCHLALELLGEARMSKAIRALIADRPNRLMEAA